MRKVDKMVEALTSRECEKMAETFFRIMYRADQEKLSGAKTAEHLYALYADAKAWTADRIKEPA